MNVNLCPHVLCVVVLSQHVALVKRLSSLLGVEGRLIEQHAALLTRGHLVQEGAVAAQSQDCGRGLLEL